MSVLVCMHVDLCGFGHGAMSLCACRTGWVWACDYECLFWVHMGLCGFGCVALTILYAHGFGYVAMTILCVPGSVWVWACGYEWLFCVHLGLCEFGYVATSACFVHVHLGLCMCMCMCISVFKWDWDHSHSSIRAPHWTGRGLNLFPSTTWTGLEAAVITIHLLNSIYFQTTALCFRQPMVQWNIYKPSTALLPNQANPSSHPSHPRTAKSKSSVPRSAQKLFSGGNGLHINFGIHRVMPWCGVYSKSLARRKKKSLGKRSRVNNLSLQPAAVWWMWTES